MRYRPKMMRYRPKMNIEFDEKNMLVMDRQWVLIAMMFFSVFIIALFVLIMEYTEFGYTMFIQSLIIGFLISMICSIFKGHTYTITEEANVKS